MRSTEARSVHRGCAVTADADDPGASGPAFVAGARGGEGETGGRGDRAGVRLIGDGFAWDARSASVPVSPLEAITAAVAVLPQPAVEEAAPKPVFAW